ncbi:MAG: glycosyltransferase family 4 protein [Nitrospinae bacterium]|nr:glycosyltransferase family 4 protein [Nitrospinota bacterium]
MKRVVHQFHAHMSSRDAIGENMLTIQSELRRSGYESEIFCLYKTEDLDGRVRHVDEYASFSSPGAVLVVHFSIGFAELDRLFAFPDRKVLAYHNITPPEFLEDFSPEMAQYCREGREAVLKFRGRIDLAVGDSEFNVRDLVRLGFEGGKAIPILFDFKKLDAVPDPEILSRYGDGGWTNWLFVGKLFPNKKQEDVIKAFYYYKKYINPRSRLILVGASRHIRIYYEYLRYLAHYLGLTDVIFTDSIPGNELAAYYRVAHLFVSMSEHEGFCVPLLEAMYSGIPIMAYDSSAVPETLGGAGALIKEKKFPEIAELAHYILENGELRKKLAADQKRRLEVYSTERVLRKWRDTLEPFFQ